MRRIDGRSRDRTAPATTRASSANPVQSVLWTFLYAADSYVRKTGGSRHDALAMAVVSLDGAVRPAG